MTETQKFIEDAIKGGWKDGIQIRYSGGKIERIYKSWGASQWERYMDIATALMDPFAWRSVSKTRNWNAGKRAECPTCTPGKVSVDWRYYMHVFIEHIAMGRTAEESLLAINKIDD